jgi:hypothetical protein
VSAGPGVAAYHRPPGEEQYRLHVVQAIEIEDGQIARTHTYLDPSILERFGLPQSIA